MRENVHTVYDRLAAKGAFSTNPANDGARDPNTGEILYKGPIPFPKMLYHPQGKKRVTSPSVTVPGPAGPTVIPEQYELLNKIVNNKAEYEAAIKEGWHEHPSDSFWSSLSEEERQFAERPAKSAQTRINSLEQQLEEMKKELELARANGARIQDDNKEEE